MAGFLPFSITSIGAAPHAAPDAAATPQTGAQGAFAAVMAELAGEGAVAEAGAGHAGSAVQRLKLAFAASDARPATFDLGGFEVKVDGVRFVRSGDAPAAGMNIEELAAIAPQAGGAPVAERAVETQRQPMTSDILPQDAEANAGAEQAAQVKVEGETAAERPKASAKAADAVETPAPEAADAVTQMAYPMAAPEPATPKATAPAVEFGPVTDAATEAATDAVAAADVDAAATEADTQPEADVAPRDVTTNRQDVSAQAESRPFTATVTSGAPEAAQAQAQAHSQAHTQAHTGAAAPADDAVAATLAALSPAAGQARPAQELLAGGAPLAGGMTMAAALAEMAEAGAPATPEAGRQPDKAALFAGVSADMPEPAGAAAETADAAENAFGLPDSTAGKTADKPGAEPAGRAGTDAGQNTQASRPALTAEQANNAQSATTQSTAAQNAATQNAATQTATAQTALPEGFQPLHAAQGYGAAPTAQPAAQPHGADVVKVATPQQLPEAMGLAISRHVSAEATEFTLRLDPAELGRVEVKLEMGKDGKAVVSIQADNASTFDLLRRDSHALERALAEAGLKLDSGGLNFSLRQQNGQNSQQFAGDGGQRPATGRMQDASLAASEQDNIPQPTRRSGGAGLLDLSI